MKAMKHAASSIAFSAIALCMPVSAQNVPQLDLPRAKFSVSVHQVTAQVAQTPIQRSTGLMYRGEMPISEGMLFIFEQAGMQCFWMKNTPLPLTAAFVADNGDIVNLVDMLPHSEAPHCSTKPVRYVLEMNQGWFAKRSIRAGARLSGEPFTR